MDIKERLNSKGKYILKALDNISIGTILEEKGIEKGKNILIVIGLYYTECLYVIEFKEHLQLECEIVEIIHTKEVRLGKLLIKDIGKYEKSGKVSKRVIEELKSILGINNCIEEYKRYLSYAKLISKIDRGTIFKLDKKYGLVTNIQKYIQVVYIGRSKIEELEDIIRYILENRNSLDIKYYISFEYIAMCNCKYKGKIREKDLLKLEMVDII